MGVKFCHVFWDKVLKQDKIVDAKAACEATDP